MTDDADMTIMLYAELLPEEESVLKALEHSLMHTLLAHSITARPVWTSDTTPGGRVVQLLVGGESEPKVLLELPATEVSNIPPDDIVSRLARSIAQS